MKYTLVLDESGNFKEETKMPSVVAGYLLRDNTQTDDWAKSVLRKVQKSNSLFSSINIDRFHGMEDFSSTMHEFSVSIMEHLNSLGIGLVCFKSSRYAKIVNSDTTYLNVFSLGIVRLFEELLIADKDQKVTIDIVYAHRIQVEKKEKTGINERIAESNYISKIDEYIALKMAQWPTTFRRNLSYNLTTGNATKLPILMLADAVNYGVRGGFQSFSAELKNRVRALPIKEFKVHSTDKWDFIKNNMIYDNLAAGVLSWYCDNDKVLEAYTDEFENLLNDSISGLDISVVDAQYNILSQYIKNVVTLRRFAFAENLVNNLINDFLPILENHGIQTKRYYFDLQFHLLTIASHKGDYKLSDACIAKCDGYLSKLELNYESLNYYFDYKIRVVEHLKNMFEFQRALLILDNLEDLQSNLIETYQLAGTFEGLDSEIKSVTLGKIYGSKLQIYSQLVNSDISCLQKGRGITDKAIGQFNTFGDKARIMQSRSALEYYAGNFEEALNWLSESLGLSVDSTPLDIIQEIAANLNNNIFALMHYSKLMGKAATMGSSIAVSLLQAYESLKVEEKLGKKFVGKEHQDLAVYPYYIIYWNVAVTKFILKQSGSAELRIAEKGALARPEEITVYIAGFAIIASRLYFDSRSIKKSDRAEYKKEVSEFLNSDVPDSFKVLVLPLKEMLFDTNTNYNYDKLKNLIDAIPVV